MIDGILAKHNASTKTCLTVKILISLAVIAMAVAFPQIVHMPTGAAGGVKWLPMYLPVIIGACVLGAKMGRGGCNSLADNRLFTDKRILLSHARCGTPSLHGCRACRNGSHCRRILLAYR